MSGFTELCFWAVKYMQSVLFTLRDKQDLFNQSKTSAIADVFIILFLRNPYGVPLPFPNGEHSVLQNEFISIKNIKCSA